MGEGRRTVSYAALLGVERGLTAIAGGGGKTSLMLALARELSGRARVILATSTRIYPPEHVALIRGGCAAEERRAVRELGEWRLLAIGTLREDGKLGPPALPFSALTELADYVLVEADGSKGLPLKAHAAHEPVIPDCTGRSILVAGLDGIGRPVAEVCHRPERYAALAGCDIHAAVTAERAARVIAAEGIGDLLYLNKEEGAESAAFAEEIAARLALPVFAGSLREGRARRVCGDVPPPLRCGREEKTVVSDSDRGRMKPCGY